jgi:ketosteroid isomerase-like protein
MRISNRVARLSLPLGLVMLLTTFAAGRVEAQSTARPGAPAPSRGAAQPLGPRERSVLAALKSYEDAVLAGDTVTLKRIWADEYTFINARGTLVTRAQRLANFASRATEVAEALNRREIIVQIYGDNATVRQLFTLRGRYSGKVLDSEVRCSFVWVWRAGRWQMVFNQLTPVVSS